MADISIDLDKLIDDLEIVLQKNRMLEQENTVLKNTLKLLGHKSEKFLKDLAVVQNKIVFVSYDGNGYGCNPKYIAEEILRRKLPFDLVWLVNDLNTPMPEKIRKVKYTSLDACYELSSAKVIVTNEMSRLNFEKKETQYLIMTWHGSWKIKLINLDLGDRVTPELVKRINESNAVTDLMISDYDEDFEEIRRAFDYKGEVLKCGLPRQDIFFKPQDNLAEKVKESLGIDNETKIMLYAPTFRDISLKSFEIYRIDHKKLFEVLQEKFGGKWKLLLRLHPILANSESSRKIFPPSENIIDVTNYPDTQELVIASDMLITDYSSITYDFMLLNKIAFILAKDFEQYDSYRGLHPNYFEMPFEVNQSEDELFDCIKNIDVDDMKNKIKDYIAEINPYDDGHASEKVVDKICAVMKE